MGAISEIPRTMWELYQCLPEGVPVQLINNQLIMSPSPKDRHQVILNRINRQLADYIENNKMGEIRIAPSDVYFNEENIFQPDIYYVSKNNLSGFQEDGFHGAPDMVIEILSPGTAKVDRTDKLKIYEASGVKEFWLVNPEDNSAIGYTNINGQFEKIGKQKNSLSSKLLNIDFEF